MKIGIFDSGIGGLLMAHAIVDALPQYEYVYLGDTARVPYGDRTEKEIYAFFEQAVHYLFEKEDCVLVVVACNTVSTASLRKLQQTYLKSKFPTRRVLGMVDPTIEVIIEEKVKSVGIIATAATIRTDRYRTRLHEKNPKIKVYQEKTPEFVPLIEAGKIKEARPLLKNYLMPFIEKKIEALVLGCTHYPMLKKEIRAILKKNASPANSGIKLISQDEFIPHKLEDYLKRHPEIEKKIAKNRKMKLLATKITPTMKTLAQKWFKKKGILQKVKIT